MPKPVVSIEAMWQASLLMPYPNTSPYIWAFLAIADDNDSKTSMDAPSLNTIPFLLTSKGVGNVSESARIAANPHTIIGAKTSAPPTIIRVARPCLISSYAYAAAILLDEQASACRETLPPAPTAWAVCTAISKCE